MQERRLFIVSNRLPFRIDCPAGHPELRCGSGGLISAVNSFITSNLHIRENFSKTYWVGTPECSVGTWSRAQDLLPTSNFECLPVFINNAIFERHNNGFCSSVIWPLFHYFPSYAEFDSADFDCYMKVNKSFLDIIFKHARPDDVIWIHDYHLLPLAELIRKEIPGITIGFFLHIPFPTYEILRLMPKDWQEILIRGVLGADLLGFHTIDYTSHFLETVRMFLGIDYEMNVLRYNGRLIKADVFPVSVDYECFSAAYNKSLVRKTRDLIMEKFKGKRIIFSIDRLDYTKGVKNRLEAYELFLSLYPEYHENVVFILIVVPSRTSVEKYSERKRIVNEKISLMNSQVGNVNWQPVVHQFGSISFEELVGFYTACDVAMITPLRDGMNLVAKEFVSSRTEMRGVLILSELAGAARELSDALIVNPNDAREMAAALHEAFSMSDNEKRNRMESLQARVKQYNIHTWAEDFLDQLGSIKKKQKEFQVKLLDDVSRINMLDSYRNANSRLLLLNYDGTLINYSALPHAANPSPLLLELLHTISLQPGNSTYIISGRDSNTLEGWFGQLPLNLVAEHGASVKNCNSGWQDFLAEKQDWKGDVKNIMERYVRRCANTMVEEKKFSLVWHFRKANLQHSKLRAAELILELNQFVHNLGLQVILGNKTIEVKNKNIGKAKTLRRILAGHSHDFILAAGDDVTDEDMFRVLKDYDNAYTFKIGGDASFAKYNLLTPQMMISILHTLSHLKEHVTQ